MWLLLTIFFLLWVLYVFKKVTYWKFRGIPGPLPLPLVGNIGDNIIGRKSSFEVFADIYKEYSNYPFVGVYRMGDPCLILRDPEIIKNVFVKDFNYFPNNDIFVDKEIDPIFGRNPFVLKDEEWKKTRQFLTSSFAPAKVKMLFSLVENVGKDLAKYLENKENVPLNAKDIAGRYTSDVVAVCAFGVEGNSFKGNSQFLHTLRKFVSPDSLQGLKLAASLFMPRFIKVKLIPKSFDDDVIEITKEILKYRKEKDIKRNDYFQAMLEYPNGTILDIAGHVFGFVIDGYETAATVLTFVLYDLAENPTCQTKLREEIETTLEKCNGDLTYEALNEMVYLEACISETLRLHPPLANLTKTCRKKYTISSTSDEFKKLTVTIEPGQALIVPLLGLHMDPKYFPSPEKYMPERFLDKTDAHKYVYMPFGDGPRTCLGKRFGLLEQKIGTVSIIRNYEISLDEKTRRPLKYDPLYFLLYPKGGAWMKFRKVL